MVIENSTLWVQYTTIVLFTRYAHVTELLRPLTARGKPAKTATATTFRGHRRESRASILNLDLLHWEVTNFRNDLLSFGTENPIDVFFQGTGRTVARIQVQVP